MGQLSPLLASSCTLGLSLSLSLAHPFKPPSLLPVAPLSVPLSRSLRSSLLLRLPRSPPHHHPRCFHPRHGVGITACTRYRRRHRPPRSCDPARRHQVHPRLPCRPAGLSHPHTGLYIFHAAKCTTVSRSYVLLAQTLLRETASTSEVLWIRVPRCTRVRGQSWKMFVKIRIRRRPC